MTKITVDKALIEQAVEAHAWALDHLPNGAAQTKVRASLASLRTALAKPAAGRVVCTNKQAMEVRNSIGLMKDEDERNNYGNHATAIKVLEAFLASPPPLAEVPEKTNAKETNADLDFYSNAAINEQRRNMVGEVAVGRSLGNRQHQSAGNSEPQGTVAVITGFDEYGPFLGWNTHWVNFPVGTKLYTSPPPPAEVPLLSDREIKQIARESGLEKNEMSGEVLYALKCVAQEQAVRQNAGLK